MKKRDVATSPQRLREMNSAAVLGYAMESETFGATDVMAATGLTRATVLGICDELVGARWIQETGDARTAGQYSRGRPARRYELRKTAGCILGIDAGQHTVTVIVADLRGNTLARAAAALTTEDPGLRADVVRKTADAAMAEAEVRPEDVFVAVIGVPAPVDAHGESPRGNAFWKNMNPGFGHVLAGPARLVIENDANLAALAERDRGGGRGLGSCVTLLSGERLGAGLVIDDSLIRGAYGGAGEMRFLEVVQGVGSAEGLGFLARKWAIAARDNQEVPAGSPLAGLDREDLSAEAVFAAAEAGDSVAGHIVERLGERLARVAFVFASLLGAEKVIIGGALAVGAGPVIEKAKVFLEKNFQAPVPELAASELGSDIVAWGALSHGLSILRDNPLNFSPRPLAASAGV